MCGNLAGDCAEFPSCLNTVNECWNIGFQPFHKLETGCVSIFFLPEFFTEFV